MALNRKKALPLTPNETLSLYTPKLNRIQSHPSLASVFIICQMGAVPGALNWLRECEAGAGNTVSVWVTLVAFCFFASDEGGLWVSEDTCARTLGLFLSQ